MYEEIYFENATSRLGGVLEAGRLCDDPAPRIETVRFSPALPGRYRVSVDFPARRDNAIDEVPYRLVVEHAGNRREVEGRLDVGRTELIALELQVE